MKHQISYDNFKIKNVPTQTPEFEIKIYNPKNEKDNNDDVILIVVKTAPTPTKIKINSVPPPIIAFAPDNTKLTWVIGAFVIVVGFWFYRMLIKQRGPRYNNQYSELLQDGPYMRELQSLSRSVNTFEIPSVTNDINMFV